MTLDLIQPTLGAVLGEAVPVFRNFSADVVETYSRYVVYKQTGAPTALPADNQPVARNPNIEVKYYYRTSYDTTPTGRQLVSTEANDILRALEQVGLVTVTGLQWLGDIDGLGFVCVAMDMVGLEMV